MAFVEAWIKSKSPYGKTALKTVIEEGECCYTYFNLSEFFRATRILSIILSLLVGVANIVQLLRNAESGTNQQNIPPATPPEMQHPAKRGNKSAKKGSITSKLIDEGIITPESLEKLRTAMSHTRSNGN